MATNIHYHSCPICGSKDLKEDFKVKDYTVSNELFTLLTCYSCTLRFTQDIPDTASIGRFYKSEDYISHTNTSKGLINRLYHAVRKRTLAHKRKLIARHTGLKSGTLLDIGSGIGSFVNEMIQHDWKAIGLEPDPDARQIALKEYQIPLKEIEELHRLQGRFDAITLWHVLEHVHELHPYIQKIKSLLAEKGKLFIAVPNYTSGDAAAYGEYWAAYDVPRHLYHFSPKSIQVLMEKNGLKVQKYLPMWYDSFYISLLSSKYKNGSTNWLGAALNGLFSNLKALGNTKRCSSVIYVIGR